jgi:DNA repair photolyase
MFMPILPGIGDSEENIKQIVQKSKEAQAEFVLPSGLTLKPGRNKQEFLTVIQKYFPDLVQFYQDLYNNNSKYGNPNPKFKDALNTCKLGHEYCRKFDIPDRVPRYIPSGVPQKNFLVSTILYNLAYYFQWVEEKYWRSVKPFTEAANAIEGFSQNISEMTGAELKNQFNLSKNVYSVVTEVLETGKSSDLMVYQDPETILVNKEREKV